MTQELAVVRAHSQELQTMDTPLSPMEVLKQVNLIQEVMKVAMKEGEHYGTIPGCPKPCLYQSGAEKLKLTFRFRDTYPRIERIDLPGGHREYIVTCALSTMSGVVLGEASASCSSMETKYRFVGGERKPTQKPVSKEYWNLKKEGRYEEAQRELGGAGFSPMKQDGRWVIAEVGEKQERENPAEVFNTILQMAQKRAFVRAIRSCTAASDIFTQDEDTIKASLADDTHDTPAAEPPPAVTKSAPKREEKPTTTAPDSGDWRDVVIHFGKNKGTRLGDLNDKQLRWYCEDWEPTEWPAGSGQFSPENIALRKALNKAGDEMANREEDNVPMQ